MQLAEVVYHRVCRNDLSSPGFCLVDLGPDVASTALRQLMLDLKRDMQHMHRRRAGRDLVFLSAARFDQQLTTKLHRDGGPDECFLMLGYEPSQVPAAVAIADYSLCAHELGMTPIEFLQRHNPMFSAGEELLRPYTTEVPCFSHRHAQIVLINNSQAPLGEGWQGVLHMATIHQPAEDRRRVVNSAPIASVPPGTPDAVSPAEQDEFVRTSVVRRRGYDKQHLSDDGLGPQPE
jgi:hypothetical protein